jgi:hypothetical protein
MTGLPARIEHRQAVGGLSARMPRLAAAIGYLRRNPSLLVGLLLLLALALFASVGRLFVDVSGAAPLSVPPARPPGPGLPLGSDPQGRNIIAVTIEGTWLTIRTGVIAGALGVMFGSALGLFAGYVGGRTDAVITWSVDVMLTIPAILFLVMIAAVVQTGLSSLGMALIVARSRLCRDGAALGQRHLAGDLRRDRAQSAALSGVILCNGGFGCHPGECRTGSDGVGAAERADPWHDHLLDHGILGLHPRDVVVDPAACVDPHRAVRRALSRQCRA